MTHGFQVPKHSVPVTLTLAWQQPRRVSLFLAEKAARHTGTEYPSDVLNGDDEFVAALGSDSEILVFHRDAVVVLTVDADQEEEWMGASDGVDTITELEVDMLMEDGTRVGGEVAFCRPEGQRRIQDYLNTADRFVALKDDDVIHLLNRRKIVSVWLR